jgi:hypothetical protein
MTQRTETCEELRRALAAAKARLHTALRSGFELEAGEIDITMHQHDRDAVNAEIDQIEQALHAKGCH